MEPDPARFSFISMEISHPTAFSNVIVGVDGREGGHDAVELAKQLAAPGARITLAHIRNTDWAQGKAGGLGVPLSHATAEALLQKELDRAGIEAETASIAATPPARGLHVLAGEIGADLLVIGSSRHASLGRVLIGSVTRTTFHGARCAIAVAPYGYAREEHLLQKLGVGYNGTPESQRALEAAQEIAARHRASVSALWVVSIEDVRRERPIPADQPEEAEILLQRCHHELERIGGIHRDAVYGGPREELSHLSQRVDLLVVGSRSYGPWGRLLHGSISSYLLGHAACPLLVLPRAAAPAPDPMHDLATPELAPS